MIDQPARSRPSRLAGRFPRRKHAPAAALVEPLEARALLAADLALGGFSDLWFGSNINTDPSNRQDLPAVMVPGDRFVAQILVNNVGDLPAVGTVTINFYLSKNTTFDTDDILVRSFANEEVSLSASGSPNSEGDFTGVLTIPTDATQIEAGDFFLIARLLPSSTIGDAAQANNIGATDDELTVALRFGTFSGRSNVPLTLTDADGTPVTWAMSGGGSGTVSFTGDARDRFNIAIEGGVTSSNLTITVNEDAEDDDDNAAVINDVTIAGSFRDFDAQEATLVGDVDVSGSIRFLRFGAVTGPSEIAVAGEDQQPTFAFGNVRNLSVTSAAPIAALSTFSWIDSDATADTISAPWMGQLVAAGNFHASLDLSGRTGGRTLGSATITGLVNKGAWVINGAVGDVSVRSTGPSFSATILKSLKSFTTTLDFRGTLTARSIATLAVGRDMRNATVLAGAFLGDDGRLGGTGDDADTFRNGSLQFLTVGRKVLNTVVGAGLDPVDGVFRNGDDRLRRGKIQRITIESSASRNSRFLAQQYTGTVSINDRVINTETDRRFQLG